MKPPLFSGFVPQAVNSIVLVEAIVYTPHFPVIFVSEFVVFRLLWQLIILGSKVIPCDVTS